MADSAHPYEILPGIASRFDHVELRERLRRVDLVAADIDECLFPGFSQSYLGHRIFFQIVTRPRAATDLRFVPQLVHGGAYIRKVKLLRSMGWPPANATLMRRYEHSMWMIPEEYFRQGVTAIPGRSFPGVVEALSLLGGRARVGLVSFGIDLVADEYRRQLNSTNEPFVEFAEANPITFEPGPDGRPAFAGYRPRPRTEPRHKREVLEARLDRHKASYPLVIGNGRDECEMAILAQERRGLSLGIQPAVRDGHCFDVVAHARDWLPVHAMLEQLLD